MKEILVPCDFSQPALNAYRMAMDIAAISKGTVHLLNVAQMPTMPNTALTPVRTLGTTMMKELSSKTHKNFDKIASKYGQDWVKVVSKVEFGVPAKTIVDYAKKHSIDLIVMGTHGVSGLKEYFVGSNTEKIVRNAPVPVIVVKEIFKGQVKDIVFPNTMDTENQDLLISKVKALQTFFKAHLHLVWVNTPINFTPDALTYKRLAAFAKRFMLKDFSINIFNHLSEEEGIIEFANSMDADLIALGTHGRKGLSHLMSGSMAEDVANHAKSLIWTYVMKKGRKE